MKSEDAGSNFDLFDSMFAPPRAGSTDPDTSHSAAARLTEFAAGHCRKIYAKLGSMETASAEQLGDALGMDPYAVRKRLADLAHAKLVEATKEKRMTRARRAERIWLLTLLSAKPEAEPSPNGVTVDVAASIVSGIVDG